MNAETRLDRSTPRAGAPRRGLLAALAALPLALGTLGACSGEDGPQLTVTDDVERCKEHLLAIHQGLIQYTQQVGRPPQSSGVALLAELIASGVWKDTPENRALLTCPGPNAELAPPDTDFLKVDRLSDASTAYAARDTRTHPFEAYPEGGASLGAVVCCDNVGGTMNHAGLMNVLYSDGSIRTFVLEDLIERGVLAPGTTVIVPGPHAPLEDLRVLTVD